VDGILAEPFALDQDGYLEIPERPGLGVALDRDKLAKFVANPAALFA
jgi:L-alanine-DL-glutamate epimerase-like enolase superfamily enzyme